jgi:hypothetical protein
MEASICSTDVLRYQALGLETSHMSSFICADQQEGFSGKPSEYAAGIMRYRRQLAWKHL